VRSWTQEYVAKKGAESLAAIRGNDGPLALVLAPTRELGRREREGEEREDRERKERREREEERKREIERKERERERERERRTCSHHTGLNKPLYCMFICHAFIALT
jgi:hypothetical protein